mmetsp:Transcript_68602/g.161278  ORF Transcript_68602/g.161278 Transcript_68602/m.161278 type:complete len:305 (-) Transcript_68602:906-1820(-)
MGSSLQRTLADVEGDAPWSARTWRERPRSDHSVEGRDHTVALVAHVAEVCAAVEGGDSAAVFAFEGEKVFSVFGAVCDGARVSAWIAHELGRVRHDLLGAPRRTAEEGCLTLSAEVVQVARECELQLSALELAAGLELGRFEKLVEVEPLVCFAAEEIEDAGDGGELFLKRRMRHGNATQTAVDEVDGNAEPRPAQVEAFTSAGDMHDMATRENDTGSGRHCDCKADRAEIIRFAKEPIRCRDEGIAAVGETTEMLRLVEHSATHVSTGEGVATRVLGGESTVRVVTDGPLVVDSSGRGATEVT